MKNSIVRVVLVSGSKSDRSHCLRLSNIRLTPGSMWPRRELIDGSSSGSVPALCTVVGGKCVAVKIQHLTLIQMVGHCAIDCGTLTTYREVSKIGVQYPLRGQRFGRLSTASPASTLFGRKLYPQNRLSIVGIESSEGATISHSDLISLSSD
jgi:hypothetical protein